MTRATDASSTTPAPAEDDVHVQPAVVTVAPSDDALVFAGQRYAMSVTAVDSGATVVVNADAAQPLLSPTQLTVDGGSRPRFRAAIGSSWTRCGNAAALELRVPFAALANLYDVRLTLADEGFDAIRTLSATVKLGSASFPG